MKTKPFNTKPTLLIMTDWFYPGYKAGGPIQSCVNLVHALEQEYNIFVITSDRDFGDQKSYSVELNQWIAHTNYTSVYYLTKPTYSTIKKLMLSISPDFIYLNSMFSQVFTIYPLLLFWKKDKKSQIVLAPRGMLHQGALQYKPIKKRLFLRLLKLLGLSERLIFHATDSQEETNIKRYLGNNLKIITIPNLPKKLTYEWQEKAKQKRSLNIIFLSRVSPKKNLIFVLELLAQITDLEIHLSIYGSIEDQHYWERCLQLINTLPQNIMVNFYGSIPNDEVYKVLLDQHLFILPTFGENYGHAIIDALSSATPVLISDQTPWRNLIQNKAGWDFPIQNKEAYIKTIRQAAMMDQSAFNVWSKGAFQFTKTQMDFDLLKKRYLELFHLIVYCILSP